MYKVQTSLAKIAVASYLLSIFPIGAGAQEAKIFSDVSSETNYSQAIQYLKDQKIVQGYPDGSFAPSSTINRAEFTKILVNAISKDAPSGSNCFSDVKADWYAPYVCTAKNLNLINGYPNGKFKPGDNINFSEAAKIIANAFKLNQSQQDPSVWFKSYIEALQREKAIPLSVEYFDEKITRDEMSEIIWRVKADINDKSSRTYQELNGDGLITANSCSDLEDRFKSVDRGYIGPMYYRGIMDVLAVPSPESESKPVTTESGGVSKDYSTTNVQVAGVDEADIIKNDGQYIYMVSGSSIRIVKASPANDMKEVINLELGPKDQYFSPSEMYVTGDTLVVMGTANINYPMPLINSVESKPVMNTYWNNSIKSQVYIIDIKDRSQPKVVRTINFDGSYNTSRRIGDNLYIVLNQNSYFPYYQNNQAIPAFEDYLPKISDSKNDSKSELAVPCNQVHIMPRPKSFNYIITAAIPLNDLTKDVSRNVVVGNSENVYASSNNLYIASTDWTGPYYYAQGAYTKLYKYALDNGKISFNSDGVVPGTILNQFSMDEFNNNLRIATTQNEVVIGKSKMTNNVFVLDGGLKTVGKIENIAPGEKIYSTRFLGNRGYMVTFKSIDPLFAFDLSNPRAPKILGELKIPGYSDYLHPYDENHLIGFGKDVDPAEVEKNPDFIYYTAVKGFKMGLFDVTDPAKPKEMFKEIIGDQGTYSELLSNHKALLFDKEKNLISFPISVTQNCSIANNCQLSANYPTTNFVGAYVYGLDLQNGFKLKAKITHLNTQESSDLLKNGYGTWEKAIQRILYIGDTLYTVSQGAVKANSLSDFRELKMIDLAASLYNITFGKTITPAQ